MHKGLTAYPNGQNGYLPHKGRDMTVRTPCQAVEDGLPKTTGGERSKIKKAA